MFFSVAADATENDGYVLVAPAVITNTSLPQYNTRVFQGLPAIERFGGRLWSAWYGDDTLPTGFGEGTGNFVIMGYSDDNGATWREYAYLVPANESTTWVCVPRMWAAPDGTLWVFTGQIGNSQLFDGQYGVWLNRILDPLAANPQIEQGKWLADGIHGRPFTVGSEWWLPVDYWAGGNGPVAPRFPGRVGKKLFRINVPSRSLTYIGKSPPAPTTTYDESVAVQLANGDILHQWRTPNGPWQSRSSDLGITWNTPEAFTALTIPNSRHSLVKLPSGNLALAFNNNAVLTTRSNMSLAISTDNGATWPHVVLLDARDQTTYPDITYDMSGNIFIAYDLERVPSYGLGRLQVLCARVSEAAVIAGTAVPVITIVSDA